MQHGLTEIQRGLRVVSFHLERYDVFLRWVKLDWFMNDERLLVYSHSLQHVFVSLLVHLLVLLECIRFFELTLQLNAVLMHSNSSLTFSQARLLASLPHQLFRASTLSFLPASLSYRSRPKSEASGRCQIRKDEANSRESLREFCESPFLVCLTWHGASWKTSWVLSSFHLPQPAVWSEQRKESEQVAWHWLLLGWYHFWNRQLREVVLLVSEYVLYVVGSSSRQGLLNSGW